NEYAPSFRVQQKREELALQLFDIGPRYDHTSKSGEQGRIKGSRAGVSVCHLVFRLRREFMISRTLRRAGIVILCVGIVALSIADVVSDGWRGGNRVAIAIRQTIRWESGGTHTQKPAFS